MAVFLVAMATATLYLFLDVVFEGIEERIWFIYFSGYLVDSFCSPCLFWDKKRENRRNAIIRNDDDVDDIVKLMTTQPGNVT